MPVIQRITAREILDSRGKPTVKAICLLASGAGASASVPSGASTGAAEAHELRDGDGLRYAGLGCLKAAANVGGEIAAAIVGAELKDQPTLDKLLIDLDGTVNKARLGANAILATSIAFARACSVERGVPLYQHFADMIGQPLATLPRLTVNLFSGGKHAGGQVSIQDMLVVPAGARTIDAGLAMVSDVYRSAMNLVRSKYRARPLKADEGGLAPEFTSPAAMFGDAAESIQAAGLRLGGDVALAVDVASSHFYEAGRYTFEGDPISSSDMIRRIAAFVNEFPVVSVEDALAEDDWANWPALRAAIGGRAIALGDDFLCTESSAHPAGDQRERGQRAAAEGEPGRHAQRVGRGAAAGAVGGMARHHQRPQRRDRRRLAGRPGGRVGRRPDQGGLHHAVGAPGKIQPPAGDRGADGLPVVGWPG